MTSKSEPIELDASAKTLREAYLKAMARHFPPSGKTPDLLFFSAPQYNTWIELTYHQNEKDILAYAKSMLDNGLPAGVLMIDDTWQYAYGTWEFDPLRFSDPKGMVKKLHAMGYKVMLWMCPFVSLDSPEFRRIEWASNPDDVKGWPTKGGLLRDGGKSGEPMIRNLEYNYHGQGYVSVLDQFMMGRKLLVAPVMEKDAKTRKVVLPPGKWLGDDGREYAGPATITVDTPLARLPHFTAL